MYKNSNSGSNKKSNYAGLEQHKTKLSISTGQISQQIKPEEVSFISPKAEDEKLFNRALEIKERLKSSQEERCDTKALNYLLYAHHRLSFIKEEHPDYYDSYIKSNSNINSQLKELSDISDVWELYERDNSFIDTSSSIAGLTELGRSIMGKISNITIKYGYKAFGSPSGNTSKILEHQFNKGEEYNPFQQSEETLGTGNTGENMDEYG